MVSARSGTFSARGILALNGPSPNHFRVTDIRQSELFRHHSYTSSIAQGVICGFGTQAYLLPRAAWLACSRSSQHDLTE
jgi:3-dehydroquinate dehydratase